MDRQTRYDEARERVEQIKGFYANLGAYSAVNLGLFTIDLATDGGPWFYWPLLGWGLGLFAHWVNVFGVDGIFKTWEERKIRELMEQEAR